VTTSSAHRSISDFIASLPSSCSGSTFSTSASSKTSAAHTAHRWSWLTRVLFLTFALVGLSNIPAFAQVTVPTLELSDLFLAQTQLSNAGLVIGAVSFTSNNSPYGTMLSYSPGAGTQVAAGSAISLVLSSGPSNGVIGGCEVCPRTAASCSVGGTTYTQCWQSQNNVYYLVGASQDYARTNPDCTPTNVMDPLTYIGYGPSPSGWYSSCHDTSDTCRLTGQCASDCYPPGQPAFSQTPNCILGKYSMAAYDWDGNLLFIVYCSMQLKDAYDDYRGDLFHNCWDTSYGGPYAEYPPQILPQFSQTVPNVVGDTQADATSALTAAGVVLGTVTLQSGTSVPNGSIISESPVAGTAAIPGGHVNLVVSSNGIVVPDVTGYTQGAAIGAITGLGLTYTIRSAYNSNVSPGDIIVTNPVAGTLVGTSSNVILLESAGAATHLNVCPGAQTSPAPCSTTYTTQPPYTAAFTIPAQTTLGAISVVTSGASNLDFQAEANDSSPILCTLQTYTSATICTVDVTFTPQAPGLRTGAINLTDSSGNLIASSFLYGIANGPAITFPPGKQITVGSGLGLTSGVALDAAGDVYITDSSNSQVVEVPAGGSTQTTVGSGFSGPSSVAVDGAGDVFVADTGNQQVEEITPAGIQTTVPATGLSQPQGVAVDGSGDVFIVDSAINQVVEVTPGGVQSTVPTNGLSQPQGVAVDGSGNVYIADTGNQRVLEITSGTTQTLLNFTALVSPTAVAVDAAGDVFVADSGNNNVVELPADGSGQFTVISSLSSPQGVAVDGLGDVFIANTNQKVVAEFQNSQPSPLTFAATNVGSPSSPQSVTVQNVGNLPLSAVAPGLAFTGNFSQVAGSGTPADCTSGLALASGSLCNLSIVFQPQNSGPLTGAAVFTDNSLNTLPSAAQTIALAGTGNSTAIAVPNVVGSTQVAASSAITSAGLVVGTVSTASSVTVPAGSVISESPVAGTLVSAGTAVALLVSSGVSVPNVVGDTQAAATSAITSAGLTVGTVSNAASSTVPVGDVISENPTAGTAVNGGSSVSLVISSGESVPNVVGDTQTAATSAITSAGLVVGTVTTASSSTVPIGSVISENPTAGTAVNGGSAVALVISSGITVPNVVGSTQAAATSAITSAGLTVGTVSNAASSTVPVGDVISENPTAGTAVNGGSAVALVISSGVSVPNVVGITQTAATSAITSAGLVVGTVTTAPSTTVPSGSVISENPTAGTAVNGGSAVNLVVSTGPAKYVLTTAASPASGGSVIPPSGNTYSANTLVYLTATPNAGYVFSNWTGPVAIPNSASTTVTMTAPETVTANFITAAQPQVTLNLTSVNFGNVYLSTVVSQIITVQNTGNATLKFTNIALTGANGGGMYRMQNFCTATLLVGKTCNVEVFFSGNSIGPRSNTLSFTDNAPQSPQQVSFTATVINPIASFNPTQVAFGTVKQGHSTKTNLTITNTGTTALTITSIGVTGTDMQDFGQINNCTSLAPGRNCTVSVTFTPTTTGFRSAALTVVDNTQTGTANIPLSGTGD
jgi:beta-lactam-binding protein with PASTA domain/sugar lactone lactonase YvrE